MSVFVVFRHEGVTLTSSPISVNFIHSEIQNGRKRKDYAAGFPLVFGCATSKGGMCLSESTSFNASFQNVGS